MSDSDTLDRLDPADPADPALEAEDPAVDPASPVDAPHEPAVEVHRATPDEPLVTAAMSYHDFGVAWFRRIIFPERVTSSVSRLLGPTIELGPIGAGPGRALATVTATGTFGEITAEEIPGDVVAYRLWLPISVDFDLDLQVDAHRFHADLTLPIELYAHAEAPMHIAFRLVLPTEHDVTIDLSTDKRRSAVLKRLAGLESELRRFIIRYMQRELEKPHITKALRIDVGAVVDGAWDSVSAQFLPVR